MQGIAFVFTFDAEMVAGHMQILCAVFIFMQWNGIKNVLIEQCLNGCKNQVEGGQGGIAPLRTSFSD